MYHPVAFGLSLTLVELPYMLAQAVVFCWWAALRLASAAAAAAGLPPAAPCPG
jgi:hypothetical protein